MPFVYIINKSNGNGTMSDNEGKFSLLVKNSDTLVCSFIGFARLVVPVNDLISENNGEIKLKMLAMPVNLKPVTISAFTYKRYERDYMNDIIDKHRIRPIDYAQSTITALYMAYSKEGRQIAKLARIFENILIEEQVQAKLSKEIVIRLTKDESIDYTTFRKYCYYLSNEYIISHDGVELYTKVMECYRKWKRDLKR